MKILSSLVMGSVMLTLSVSVSAQTGAPAPAWYPPPPPGYYAPAPIVYGEPPERPKTLPYRDDGQRPAGYVLEEGPRRGLVIAGSITFGTLYGLTLLGATSGGRDTGWLAIPVLGPLIYARQTDCDSDYEYDCSGDDAGDFFLTIDALGQAAGALMLGLGVAYPTKRWVREDIAAGKRPAVSVAVAPRASVTGGYGLSAVGTF